ncbi:MAG: hypothetical protein Q4E42_01055 [Phascolarctobacterium sp.]|nr:hypothetical protein [Phascolarctobacterium sp.]
MPKIQKGLSDAEMLKGYVEENTVHMYDGNSTLKRKAKEKAAEEVQLPQEQIERLNRFLTEIGMERMMKKLGAAAWQVSREGDKVVIQAKSV